ncbi:hypothetical protein FRC09_018520 [Ceratobasidium sp. 395]|nr:hypothetical protein FRC09_018520 [Ceratobasidium sp. 395]
MQMMSFPSSPSPGSTDLHGAGLDRDSGHEARSEVESIPIGLAVDFADEMEFGIGLVGLDADGDGDQMVIAGTSTSTSSPVSPSTPLGFASTSSSSSTCPISPTSQVTDFSMAAQLSPTQTYMTTPPGSPLPQSSSSHETSEPGPSWKGKGRAIPTPIARLSGIIDPRTTFQTPPDTTFGTPGAGSSSSGPSRGRPAMKTREEREREDLPSIMPLSPSPSPSPTPRPSRVRAISQLSFTSLRETIRSRSRSGTASPLGRASFSGASSPLGGPPEPKHKLSLKGLAGALMVKRKSNKSRPGSGLSSENSSAFQTPSSSLPRRGVGVQFQRPSVAGVWAEQEGGGEKGEIVSRPVRGRAETAPVVVGDYFGFGFEVEREDEPSREDASDVVQMGISLVEEKPVVPLNPFDTLPRELHLLVLVHLVESYISDYNRAIRDGTWSASQAASEKWYGQAAGLRAIIRTARVSRTWHALAHDGTFWTKLAYSTLVPPRLGVPAITSWLPYTLRHEAKASVTIEQLDAQDERVMRLVRSAGPCLSELDARGWVRFGAADVKRILGWITMPSAAPTTAVVPMKGPVEASPVRSLLSLTRFDAVPAPPTRTTNLTRLVLTSCVKLPTQALNALLSASPSLTRLEMRALPSVTDDTCAILATRCRALAWLDIGRCPNLGPSALPAICGTNTDGGLRRLKVLHMSGYPHVDPSVFSQLGETLGGTLETLDLAGVWGVTDACLAAYVDIEPSAAEVEMARLAEIERWARSRASSTRPDTIIPPAPFITLTAREAGLDPTLRGPFYRRRTALRHLNLSGCRRISDSGMGALAYAVPDLEILELAGIGASLGSAGLVRLVRTTRKLRMVDLEDAGIGDDVIEALTPPMSDSADQDGTDTSSIASDESIQIAMRTDPVYPGHALTHLVVSHCTQITSSALAQLVRACPRLSVLSVDGTTVDDRVVRFFVCAARARGLVGAEVGATDTRFVARAGLPTSGVRARRGTREFATRGLGYVDARDPGTATAEAEDECDESKVVVKTYWSWQGVDGLLERRRAMLGRRNTDGGSAGGSVGPSGLRGGSRWGRHRHDERGGCVVM